MDLESIYSIIIAAAPALTAIIGCISAFFKIKKENKISNEAIIEKFDEVKTEVMKTKEYEELKTELVKVHEENRTLKRQINELLTKIDRIARNEEE